MKEHFENQHERGGVEREMTPEEIEVHKQEAHAHLDALREALGGAGSELNGLLGSEGADSDRVLELEKTLAELQIEIADGEEYVNLMEGEGVEFRTKKGLNE